ncbi:MAG: hypothetical protein QXK12_08655 [Candidatus Nezhaarchaeales archaeon]
MKPLPFFLFLTACAVMIVSSVYLAFTTLSENPFKAAGLGASFLAFAALMMLVMVSLACAYVEFVRE